MQNILRKYISGKKVLVLFILTNTVYVFMLVVTIPDVMQYTGDMELLDMMPGGYSPEYVMTLFNKLGDAGRNTYYTNKYLPICFIPCSLQLVTHCCLVIY